MMTTKDRGMPTTPKVGITRYEVGYGKPPTTHQFQLGRSGNPKGRPKGAKNKYSQSQENKLAKIIIKEAERKISIQEKGKKLKIAISEAIVRALNVSAAKGDVRAQRLSLKLMTDAENKIENDRLETLRVICEYKAYWERELEWRTLNRINLPDPIPHPDDILIDYNTCQIQMEGPFDGQSKLWWADILQQYLDLETFVHKSEERLINQKNMRITEIHQELLQHERSVLQTAYNAIGKKAYIIRNKSKFRKISDIY